MWENTKAVLVESLQRMLEAAARLLPGLIALLVLVLVSTVLAVGVRLGLRRLCARVGLDRRAREWGLAGPEGRGQPSRLVERVGGWVVVAVGFLVGLNVLEAGATSALALRLIEYVPHVLLAALIVVIGAAAARILERSVLIGAVNMGIQSARFLGLGVRWMVLVTAAAMALEHLGVGGSVLVVGFGILVGGIALALALAVGLGARDMVSRSLERRFPPRAEGEEAPEEEQFRHM
jgi:hypothetical protein